MNIFNVNGGLYKFMSRLLDMLKLNAMWLLCSIPIVTMGAATTAAYTITLKMVNDEEGYIAGPFWKEFKANLKRGSIIGTIGLVASYALYLDFQLYKATQETNGIMFMVIFVLGLVMVVTHLLYSFPLLARYENTVFNTLRNSHTISVRYFLRTLLLVVLLLLEVGFFIFNRTTIFLGILIGPACLILTASANIRPIFAKIEDQNEEVAAEKKKEEADSESDEEAEDDDETENESLK